MTNPIVVVSHSFSDHCLVLGDVTLVVSQDFLDLRDELDILNGFCDKDSMEDNVCCFLVGDTSGCFLIHLELSFL